MTIFRRRQEPSLFPTGDQLADEAIARVEEHADEDWMRDAFDVVGYLARTGEPFTTDDVWRHLSILSENSTHEPRALGAVMRRAVKAGLIEATAEYRKSKRPECHGNPKRVWVGRP